MQFSPPTSRKTHAPMDSHAASTFPFSTACRSSETGASRTALTIDLLRLDRRKSSVVAAAAAA